MDTNIFLLKESHRDEIEELVKLVRMDEKYSALVSDGFLPIDDFSSLYNFLRTSRIKELSQKYGISSASKYV
ncbi:hypothetical protein QCD83_20750 [Pseudomonas savastanoi pv. phaseolicola]|uniref:hypothetical protein n=1 Tax=Pseudomonas savastanoi TaxID=29438 RepID=UPI000E31186E|nr:hypothetical protein [Pseudomonas savastanoi]MDG6381292.1 hypothetical protein [Pseudomonas savastanoi pv. phaseolicola]